jgi:putative hydrolase of the HAD superfamily
MKQHILLFDYGEVISQPQPESAVAAMATVAGLDPVTFQQRYWKYRPSYDEGSSARLYWSQVLGRPLTEADRVLGELVTQDVASWSHLNAGTIDVLTEARRRGMSLSLLSNAPHALASAIEADPTFGIFQHLFFSAYLGVAKPSPAAFQAALDSIDVSVQDVVFIDDKPENTDIATALGISAILFTSATELWTQLELIVHDDNCTGSACGGWYSPEP